MKLEVNFFKYFFRIFIGFTKMPCYQNVCYPDVLLPKCPVTKMSCDRNVLLPKCQLPKRPLPKCPLPKCLDTKMDSSIIITFIRLLLILPF
ncbi:hypothetical protein NP493_108g02010 [Ridgeia piscesae]|uniref:Uncharacterized protein n=1 Tax=Ridgeia piscesae TaxID=27915 RepID=A0AAD9P744_RIDPI|nr:hypothetical protein NP493_108g02010 [Ridgeia piscesae]